MGPYLMLKFSKSVITHRDVLTDENKLPESVINFMTLDLNIVKTIRRSYDCKFNDVIFVMFGSALRRYLLDSVPETKLPRSLPFFSAREIPRRPTEMCNYV